MTAKVLESNGHTAECNKERNEWIQRKISYEEVYPNYCRHCFGWGTIHEIGDLVDYGSTQVHLPSTEEPCSYCWEEGICPRCGKPLPETNSEEIKCPECEWGYHRDEYGVVRPNDPNMGLPEEPECDCWYNERFDPPADTPEDWLEFWIGDKDKDQDG